MAFVRLRINQLMVDRFLTNFAKHYFKIIEKIY